MSFKGFLYIRVCLISVLGCLSDLNAQATFDIESGLVFTGYNNVRIPGNQGTLFSLKDDFNAQANAFIRIRAGYTMKSRHTLTALYAPLIVKSEGINEIPIDFQGLNFAANTFINATYRFNSW